MRIFLFLFWNFCNAIPIIDNIEVPVCKNCIHYRPSFYSSDFSLSKCDNFGRKDILTGEIEYKYADFCRKEESMCGHIGKYYERDKNADIKLFLYSVAHNIPSTLLVALIVLSSIVQNKHVYN